MSDKIVCNEEAIKGFYKNNPEHADMLRMCMKMQQEDVGRFSMPYVNHAKSLIYSAPKEMQDSMSKFMSIQAGTIAANIVLNLPGFNKEQFLDQLDEMIELKEKYEREN